MSTIKNKNIYILESVNAYNYLNKKIDNYIEQNDFKQSDKDNIIKYVLHVALSIVINNNTIRNIIVINNNNSGIYIYNNTINSIIYKVSRILEHDNILNIKDLECYYIKLDITYAKHLIIKITPTTGEKLWIMEKTTEAL